MMRMLLTTVDTECIQSKLTLKYLYNVVADAPIDVETAVFGVNDTVNCIYEEIVRGGYSVVYFHCDMLNEEKILHISEVLKKAVPTSVIILGGMHVSFGTGAFMKMHPEVDYVIRGEGEQVLYNFLKAVLTYKFDFALIPGLAYWEADEVRVNPLPEPMRFGDIPFPYERTGFGDCEVVYYESFRGCPDRCTYSQHLPEKGIRMLPLRRVFKELKLFLDGGAERVVFIEKWFNFSASRAYRIWEYIIENDNGVTSFTFDVNGDLLDDETVHMLQKAREGLIEFNVDIESTNAEVLAAAGRKENIYQLLSNVSSVIRKTNVKVNVFQKAGMPCETAKLFARAFNKIYNLGADSMKVDVLRLMKGTYLRENAGNFGYMYSSKAPHDVIANDCMSAQHLIIIKMAVETAELFMGGEFGKTLARMRKDTAVKPFELFMMLGEFIYKKGFSCKGGDRAGMYRILYSFATALYNERNDTLRHQVMMGAMLSDNGIIANLPSENAENFDRKGRDTDAQRIIRQRQSIKIFNRAKQEHSF